MKVRKAKRDKRRAYAEAVERSKRICSNCKKPGWHYVPPALGGEGFYACEHFDA